MNQVKYDYNTQGLLSRERVSHSGAVTDVTPSIAYSYDVSKSGDLFAKHLRPTGFTTPSGTFMHYTYGVSDSVSDLINRITGIQVGVTPVVNYTYTGVQNITGVSYPESGVSLDYTSASTRDRFGRVVDHAWKKADNTSVVQIQHGYDRGGNRLYRRDMVASSHSELYQYDQMNQLVKLERGALNSSNTAIVSNTFEEDFTYDVAGNWLNYKQDASGDGTFEVNQTRTHNAANEILTIAGSNASVAHDRNGCMTKVPQPNTLGNAYTLVYDAWNRLTQVKDGTAVVATYVYDARNHRIKTTVGDETRLYYFNQQWQCVEERVGTTVDATWIYGLRYIDDVICRVKNTEVLYALQDPNWNVVAVLNSNGTVAERMTYDSFGRVTFRDASFVANVSQTTSSYNWTKTFTGQVYDTETGLMLYRNRYYHTGLGRFITRDPIGYDGRDSNLYRYVRNYPVLSTDAKGLKVEKTGVQYCKAYTKGACLLGGVVPTHWFIKIDGIGFGKFEKNLQCVGTGEIRDDDHIMYPTVDPDTLEEGEQYSICVDVVLDSDCYDLNQFKQVVKNRTRLPAGIYIVGVKDCSTWADYTLDKGRRDSQVHNNTRWAFLKCAAQYATIPYYPLE